MCLCTHKRGSMESGLTSAGVPYYGSPSVIFISSVHQYKYKYMFADFVARSTNKWMIPLYSNKSWHAFLRIIALPITSRWIHRHFTMIIILCISSGQLLCSCSAPSASCSCLQQWCHHFLVSVLFFNLMDIFQFVYWYFNKFLQSVCTANKIFIQML